MSIREKIGLIMGFPIQGPYKSALSYLDRTGAIDKKKQLEMILALCERVEELEGMKPEVKDYETTTLKKVSL